MKRPAFQFYVMDWLSDPNVVMMSAEERGMYIQLLCYMWNTDDCTLPNDEMLLLKLCQGNAQALGGVLKCFATCDSDASKITHKRLLKERMRQDDFRKDMSKASKKRWSKAKNGRMPKHTVGNAEAIGRVSSSTSSSTSISNKEKYKKKIESLDVSDKSRYEQLDALCTEYGFENDVNPDLYFKALSEFSPKFQTWPAVKECLFWCKEKGMKKINAIRIRNWFENKKKWDKDSEIKKQTERQDSQGKDVYKKVGYSSPVDFKVDDPRLSTY